jgi:5-methyltetrahydrofolate--homocysteine methyltransferase
LNKSKQNVFFQENFEKQQKLREALSRKEEKPLTPIGEARGKGLELF